MPQLISNIFDELMENIDGEVYVDKLMRYMLSTDGSMYMREPACLVYPLNSEDVLTTVKFAVKYGLSVHPRGAGSGLCGAAVGRGIILDFTKFMNKLINIDYENKTFVCQPGYRLGELERALNNSGLFFPPDPSSGEYATFGGMYATNASGAHSFKYGNVGDYLADAEIVFSNGAITNISNVYSKDIAKLGPNLKQLSQLYENNTNLIEESYPDIAYNVSGYNLRKMVKEDRLDLTQLLAGSEGTLAIVTSLKFKLLKKPEFDSLVIAYFDDIIASSKAVQRILPLAPAGIEIMDKSLLNLAKENDDVLKNSIPDNIDSVLLIDFDSEDSDECVNKAKETVNILSNEGLSDKLHLALYEEEKKKFWAIRKSAVPILYKLKGDKRIVALIEDAAVPTDKLTEYFEGVYKILNTHHVDFVVYGHIAKGLLHTRPLLNTKSFYDIELLKVLADEVFELVRFLGGTISGEHGDGRIRSSYIKKQYPKTYDLFCQTKNLLDESNILNPEIKTIYNPDQVKEFLRYGVDYKSFEKKDKNLIWHNDFLFEIEKCHGCSKCTTVTETTRMCPIYKFTRDEAAAPKAKANVLRALISGVIEDKSIYEASFQNIMNKCVTCGSCLVECPSNVNIPKLAMEAKSQYIKRYGSPLEYKIVTNGENLARMGRKILPPINFMMKSKILRKINETITGISAEREFPAISFRSLKEMISKKEAAVGGIKVLYFAGCYYSYFEPEVSLQAIKVLEKLGMTVLIPDQHCCGIPMLSKGMVKEARKKVKKNIKAWGALLNEIDYIVVTCSSCGLALKKEWGYILQDEIIEKISSKTIHISSLINNHIDKLSFKESNMHLAYHMPCHLKIQNDAECSVEMLSKVDSINVEHMNSHCCGLVGSWGISSKNYDLSVKIGSDMAAKLNTSGATIGVTDCPSCRMQMKHLSNKEIRHPVEIIAKCMK